MQVEQNEIDKSQFTEEEIEQMKEAQEILDAETIEPTVALNILLGAVNASYNKDHFNDLDRALIGKALITFKNLSEAGEDFTIKVK
jgi:hypothetical protein